MIKKHILNSIIIILILFFFSCENVSRRRVGNSNHKRKLVTPTIPGKNPEEKKDTVYIIVPNDPNSHTIPTVIDDDEDIVIIPSSKELKPLIHRDNLPEPPRIDFDISGGGYTRKEYIENNNITGDMKDLVVACDYDNPTVRNNSVALVAISSGNFNLGQICDIFDFCYINWSYVNDPVARDYYARASETLKNKLNGDCDDFAILICSMILSIGGEARINFAYNETGGHAFTEVNIGKTNRNQVEQYLIARYGYSELWHKEDSNGNWWLNLDWQGKSPGSKYWAYTHGTCFNIVRNEVINI